MPRMNVLQEVHKIIYGAGAVAWCKKSKLVEVGGHFLKMLFITEICAKKFRYAYLMVYK